MRRHWDLLFLTDRLQMVGSGAPIGRFAFIIVVKDRARGVVLLIDLLEEAVLASTPSLLLAGTATGRRLDGACNELSVKSQ